MNITIDDASPQFDYVLVGGNATVDHSLWVNGYNKVIDPDWTRYYQGTVYRTTGENNFWSHRFNASSIRVYGSCRGNHGMYGAKLDDQPEVDANAWIDGRIWDYMKAEFKDLDPNVTHNITMMNRPSLNTPPNAPPAESYFDVDYVILGFDVDGEIRTTRHGIDGATFQYEGDWKATTPDAVSAATVRRSTTPGSSVKLYFTGMSVQIFGGIGPAHGEYSISLDGVEAFRTFNAALFTDVTQVPLYTASGLEDGPHVLELTNRGKDRVDAQIDIAYAVVNTTLAEDAPLPAGVTITSSSTSSAASATGRAPGANPSASSGATASDMSGNQEESEPAISGGAIAGIAIGAAVLLGVVAFAIWFFRRKKRVEPEPVRPWSPPHTSEAGRSMIQHTFPVTPAVHHDLDYASGNSYQSSGGATNYNLHPDLMRMINANPQLAAATPPSEGTSEHSIYAPPRPIAAAPPSVVPSSAALEGRYDHDHNDEAQRRGWGAPGPSAGGADEMPPPAYVSNGNAVRGNGKR